jgi:hypothetical protein
MLPIWAVDPSARICCGVALGVAVRGEEKRWVGKSDEVNSIDLVHTARLALDLISTLADIFERAEDEFLADNTRSTFRNFSASPKPAIL